MPEPAEVIYEFTQVGTIMRVCAVDVATGTEVIIQGPAAASQKELQSVARRKLQYVMEKKAKAQ